MYQDALYSGGSSVPSNKVVPDPPVSQEEESRRSLRAIMGNPRESEERKETARASWIALDIGKMSASTRS